MPARYRLGDRVHDLGTRTLVMGILNRTPDSFYDRGATFALDAFLQRADAIVAEGADIVDVGGVKAGPGDDVSEDEELDRVVGPIEALHDRFDVAISCDTWRAAVLDAACAAGAVVGNDISGFGDADYLRVAAKHRASVVATHIRLRPRVADPEPHYDDLLGDVTAFLLDRAARPRPPGSHRSRSRSTPGSTWARRPPRARSCCARATRWPRTGMRCCCPRRTSVSSGISSTWRSATGVRRRWRRWRTASRTGAASCACTTWQGAPRCAE